MQYLLTKEEYSDIATNTLNAKTKAADKLDRLVDICILEGEMKCIHSKISTLRAYYCDDCPLTEFCSKPKDFSQ